MCKIAGARGYPTSRYLEWGRQQGNPQRSGRIQHGAFLWIERFQPETIRREPRQGL